MLSATPVLLVSMPFGVIHRPNLGVSLLKTALLNENINSKIKYFTLEFAERVGLDYYRKLSEGWPYDEALLGEFVFSSCFNNFSEDLVDEYFKSIISEQGHKIPLWVGELDTDLFDQIKQIIVLSKEFLNDCYLSENWSDYKVIGFSSMFQQQFASLSLAKLIKANHPEIQIIFGGPNCEGVMGKEMLNQFDFIDVVISGAAELTLPIVIKRILNNLFYPDVHNVFVKNKGFKSKIDLTEVLKLKNNENKNLDWLPVPDFSDFFIAWNTSYLSTLIDSELLLETSRGCWWGQISHCTFCGLNGESMAFRSKSAERAYVELKSVVQKYNCYKIQMVDNILDMNYFKNGFLQKLESSNLPIKLFYEIKANVNKTQLNQLKKAGVFRIQPGIESLNTEVLNLMGKGVKAVQNILFLKKFVKKYS